MDGSILEIAYQFVHLSKLDSAFANRVESDHTDPVGSTMFTYRIFLSLHCLLCQKSLVSYAIKI